RRESFLRGFIRAFRSGFRALVRAPRAALLGILCGWIVQASLCGVLALNLMATSQNPLPWARLGWTLPVILAISAMPVSVGGLGTREGASMFLLGLYGVPESTAVASSLLTLGVIAFWAFAGGLLFLREAARRRPAAGHVPEASIPPCH
ncbi:MAG TPA: lysylphosphatidylglycerol synthase domain-containing protein, partial [Verrucomicrobiae bacterium]|nr:lysylphosphatidylglycerol synthase domain-containing protein [Verrucomicrobiae bacterium]